MKCYKTSFQFFSKIVLELDRYPNWHYKCVTNERDILSSLRSLQLFKLASCLHQTWAHDTKLKLGWLRNNNPSFVFSRIIITITGAYNFCQPWWRWTEMKPMNLIPTTTNTGELGFGGLAIILWTGRILHSDPNIRWTGFFYSRLTPSFHLIHIHVCSLAISWIFKKTIEHWS